MIALQTAPIMSVNAVSAFFHDHLFVPLHKAEEALAEFRKGAELALSPADPADDTNFGTDPCPDRVRPSRLPVASRE